MYQIRQILSVLNIVTGINSSRTITEDGIEEGVIYGVTIGNEGSVVYGEHSGLGYNLFTH